MPYHWTTGAQVCELVQVYVVLPVIQTDRGEDASSTRALSHVLEPRALLLLKRQFFRRNNGTNELFISRVIILSLQ